MEINETFAVDHPIEKVWETLKDVHLIVSCMPGASLTDVVNDHTYRGKLTVRFGPMSADFVGEIAIERDEVTHSGSISGTAADQRSGTRARVKMDYRLIGDTRATTVNIDGDVALMGPLAQFGRQGLIKDLSRRLTGEFADRLKVSLNAGGRVQEAGSALRPASLIIAVIWHRIRGYIMNILGRADGTG